MTDLTAIASIGAAFAAGLLSVFSPCVLPLMPAYLSLISGVSVEEMQDHAGEQDLRRRVLRACLGFVCGFSAVFVLGGASATFLGSVLRAWRMQIWGLEVGIAQLAGLVLVLFGLHLTGLLPIHLLYRTRQIEVRTRQPSFKGTFVIGAAFAFGWTPCVGPILAGIFTLAGTRETVLEGMGLLAVYSAGLAVPFLLAGWSIEFFFRAFQRLRNHFRLIELASGVLLIAVGLLVFTDKLSSLNSYFAFLNRFLYAAESTLL
jgi:cytochrome c-type biogenesis protein